jgi:4a-hydroxytetrahydrobiopterin dehydratase
MSLLNPSELKQASQLLAAWQVRPEALQRTYEFVDFVAAMRFVNSVAALAENQGHHPDIDIRYNRVLLRIFSHDSGGVTTRDVELAQAIEQIAD